MGYIHIQIEGAGFRHPCRSRHSVHPERPVFKGGRVLFPPLIQTGYIARIHARQYQRC
jgi:hypothetical protein